MNSVDILGTEKVGKLLYKYAVPSIIAMVAQSLYNLVDSIFIGHGVGVLAIAALAIALPLMNLSSVLGSMVGSGASTFIALKLGEKDKKSASLCSGNVVLLNLIIGISYTIIVLIFLDPILLFFGASEDTLPLARDYMQIIIIGNIITQLFLGLNEVIRSSGYPQKAMKMMLLAVILNCFLDALFIFGFGWGIKGAAYATVLAQIIALLFEIKHLSNKNHIIHFERNIFHLRKNIASKIITIGLSPFLVNVCSSLVVIIFNNIFKKYGGDLYIAAYGIVNRLLTIVVMILMGLSIGMQPVFGYNFGAKLYPRVKRTLGITLLCGISIASFAFILFQSFPELLCKLFSHDSGLIEISSQGLRIMSAMLPFVGFQIVASNFFLSIGYAKKSIFLSLTRQFLFLIPCILILPKFLGITGVWASAPLADLISAIVTGIMLLHQIKLLKRIQNHAIQ
ncbi:MAG: MATE family efflux transporter [Bacteroidales bacterium]|jgi:putative MATE family efflux protein|nr:MATE family efflux transporter [Bacteroidales bacterium]